MVSVFALMHLVQGHWQWLAPLLAWVPMPLLNLWRRFKTNAWYRDERERPVMTLTLLAVAMVLITGEREAPLWCTLAGLFGLLLLLFVATAVPRGLREKQGNSTLLAELEFSDAAGKPCRLRQSLPQGPVMALFVHSPSQVYGCMAVRELQQWLQQGHSPIPASQIVVIFPGDIPAWVEPLKSLGVHCWQDSQGASLATLGLWLRGGNVGFPGGPNAARPALAVLADDQQQPGLWQVADNLRMPPSLEVLQSKIDRLVK